MLGAAKPDLVGFNGLAARDDGLRERAFIDVRRIEEASFRPEDREGEGCKPGHESRLIAKKQSSVRTSLIYSRLLNPSTSQSSKEQTINNARLSSFYVERW